MSNIDEITGQQLARQLKEGSAKAFGRLYDRYWSWLLNMAVYQLRDRAIAEEIVQDVFLGLWERKGQEIVLNVQAYLAKAVKFAVFKHILREKRRNELIDLHYFQAQVQDDEAMLEARFLEEFVNSVVDGLPEKCRQVFIGSRREGLTIGEIAVKMNIAEKTVEGHLTKALRVIRISLKSFLIHILVIVHSFFF